MKVLRIFLTACAISAFVGSASAQVEPDRATAPAPARGVTPPAPPARPTAPATVAPAPPPDTRTEDRFQGFDERRYVTPVFRLGSPYTLSAGAEVSDVTVVLGDEVTIDGHVDGDLVAVLGNLHLGSTAVVDGDVVVVGGDVTVAAGAAVGRDFVIVGGGLEAPSGFVPRGEHIVIGPPAVGSALRSTVPWVTRGLMWGRVIVPSVGWVWWFVGLFLLVYIALALAFPKGARLSVDTLGKRPLSAFFAGLFTLLLVGPISAVLAISLVGVVVIPFLFCAVVVAGLVGKVAVFEWLGAGLVHQDEPESRSQTLRSLLIGFAVIVVAYMVPVVGLATWALVGVLGLGAASLTFFSALKRERPAPKPKPDPPPASPGVDQDGPAVDVSYEPSVPLVASIPPSPPPVQRVAGGSSDLSAYPRATFLDRAAAGVLDAILVVIAVNVFNLGRHIDEGGAFFLLLLAYHMAFWAWKGTTVGGIMCSLRVIRTDGSALRPVDAVVRGLSSLFSIFALGLGFFWILLDSNRERQAWHDQIAGTLVVKVPRDLPLP